MRAKVFLSAIDPGTGKSKTVEWFAKALIRSEHHRHVGMLINVGRIMEAVAIANDLAEYRTHIAVLTNDETANALSGCSQEQAQVLITTQQRIERATEGRSFEEVASFHYRGMPRAVRVWDEAWLPGKTVLLDGDDVGTLLKTARRCSLEFRSALIGFMATIEKTNTGDMLDVPDWERLYGVTHGDLLAALPGGPDQARQDLCTTAASLFMVAGRSVRIWRDNQSGSGILSFKETLPKDLAPLLVLDASGRVRQTYRDLEASRGLQRLRSAEKDYAPLRVHWWDRGGGKSSFNLSGTELCRGVVETIQTKPTERWLVVTHKTDPKVGNVEREISKRLPPEVKPNVSFITWGNHVATNEYVDVPNLILAGTLFMKPSHYVALTHLAQDRPTDAGFVPDDAIERTTWGEHANLILQAVCRGRVRKSDGDRCLPMDAYLIATKRSGIGDLLPTIFPGCTVLKWDPLSEKQTLTPSLRAAREFLRKELARGITEVAYRNLQAALGISAKKFPERVSQRPEWPELIAGLGLEIFGGTKRARGVRIKVIAKAA